MKKVVLGSLLIALVSSTGAFAQSGAATGAATGAVGGAIVGGPAGAAVGATVGAVAGGISDETEVWLDFTIQPNGTGAAVATVPFTIPEGAAGAVVIHAMHTDHVTGAAGARWACLPVQF